MSWSVNLAGHYDSTPGGKTAQQKEDELVAMLKEFVSKIDDGYPALSVATFVGSFHPNTDLRRSADVAAPASGSNKDASRNQTFGSSNAGGDD